MQGFSSDVFPRFQATYWTGPDDGPVPVLILYDFLYHLRLAVRASHDVPQRGGGVILPLHVTTGTTVP